jgi:hypothetical protein
MTPQARRGVQLGTAFFAGAGSVGLLTFFVAQGLDRADKFASVIAAIAGLAGLATALTVAYQDRTRTRDTSAGINVAKPMLTRAAKPPAGSLAARFFYDSDNPHEIERSLASANVVWMWGATLTMHIPYFAPLIEKRTLEGKETRILLLAPDSASMKMAALRSSRHSEGQLGQELRANLERLTVLLQRQIELPVDCDKTRRPLQVRVVDYLAPYALYAYDPGQPDGMLEIRISTFRGTHYKRPTFRLVQDIDREWFDHFRNEFEKVWDVSTPVVPDRSAR